MSVSVTVAGTSYTIPTVGETSWGPVVTSWIQAISAVTLQTSGGSFTLTSDLNFGSNFGLLSLYYKSVSANIAGAGVIRLANSDGIGWRDSGNTTDYLLQPHADGILKYNGIDLVNLSASQTLTNKTLTAPVIATISNTGTLTLPTSTDTLVGRATTDTLTNKTLTAPVIATIVNTGTITLPTATDTLVGRATTDTLTNKTISGSSNTLSNISLTASVTGQLPVANGGTALASGTSGGILGFTGSTTIASSGALTANQLIIGGGAGATPSTLAAGSQYQVLVMGASNPGYGQLNLAQSAAITGTLPVGNGGTGQTTLTNHGVLIGAGASGITQLAAAAAGSILLGQGASSDPAFSAAPVLGVAGTTLGTLGLSGNTSGVVTIQPQAAAGTYNFNLPTTAGSVGQYLTSQGGGSTAMTWSTIGGITVANKTGNYTLTTSDGLVTADASGGAFTLTLPTAVGATGTIYRLKKTDSSLANAVTIATTSSQTIDGVTTTTLNTQYEQLTVVSDGANWQILERRIPSIATTYTPTFNGFGTATSVTFTWTRVGHFMFIEGAFTTGTVTASQAKVSLPSNVNFDTTNFSGVQLLGYCGNNSSVNATLVVSNTADTTTNLYFATVATATSTINGNTSPFANSQAQILWAKIPVSGWKG